MPKLPGSARIAGWALHAGKSTRRRADLCREGQCKPLLPLKSASRFYLAVLGDAVFLHSVWPEGAQTTHNIN